MKPQGPNGFRQNAAQILRAPKRGLAVRRVCVSVGGVVGMELPAPVTRLKFRTPSLSGRSDPPSVAPLALFPTSSGRVSAEIPESGRQVAQIFTVFRNGLRDGGAPVQDQLRNSDRTEGRAECRNRNSSSAWRCAQALPPVATRRPNRRFTVAARGCLPRLSSMATLWSAPLPARRATFSIARWKKPATDAVNIIRAASGPAVFAWNAVSDQMVRSGVLRSDLSKTEDIACSTRS